MSLLMIRFENIVVTITTAPLTIVKYLADYNNNPPNLGDYNNNPPNTPL